jgi:hypothetical protein
MPAKAGQTALSGSQIKPPALPEVHDWPRDQSYSPRGLIRPLPSLTCGTEASECPPYWDFSGRLRKFAQFLVAAPALLYLLTETGQAYGLPPHS